MTKLIWSLILLVMLPCVYGQNALPLKKLDLQTAIELGLKNNPELKAAGNKINAAKGRYKSGISLPSPEISLTYELVPSGKGLNNFEEKTIEIKQSFDFPTKYFVRGSILSAEEEIENNKYNATEAKLIAQVKNAYYTVLAKIEQLKLASENIEILSNFYDKAVIKLKAGEGTELEKMTAKVQLSEAKNNSETIKNQLRSAYSELNKVMGCGSDYINDEIFLTDTLGFSGFKITFNEVYQKAVNSNPQIKINSLAYDISKLNKTMAWSGLLPDMSISYMSQSTSEKSGYYGASFGINVPLWFLFKQSGDIQEASANSIITENELTAERNSLYTRIKNIFGEYDNYRKQIELYLAEIIPESNEIHRVAVKSYEAGEISYLEYLQSKQSLINAKNNFINLLLSYNTTVAELEQESGLKITN